MNNEIILVDIYDNIIGYSSKDIVHKSGLLHRAFSVFLFNKDKIILQKRSSNKYHSAGLWTNSCCSHPKKNEKLDVAVKRRLNEELGIKCNITEIGSVVYFNKFKDNLYEYEYDHIVIGNYEKNITNINKDEIEEIKLVDLNYLKKDVVQNPSKYSVWFLTILPIVLKYVESKKILISG